MNLARAQLIAGEILETLKPFCSSIAVAGSIRRRRPIVNDIDLVLIPSNQGQFAYALQQLGKVKMSGAKIIRVGMGFTKGIDLDVYVATPEIWATLLLIRTGSKEHNILMCSRAKRMDMKLHADGRGLFKIAHRVGGGPDFEDKLAGDTEESIFKALGLPYKEPWEREVL